MPSPNWENVTIVVLGVAGLTSVVRWLQLVKRTTLVSVVIWTAVSLISLVGIEILVWAGGGKASESGFVALRFAAATSTFCPFVARLGAKRPQHAAWQFVVLTLWLMLALPAAESLVLQPDQPLEVAGARSWFLALLILVGLFDRILTRFACSAVLVAVGQVLLLAAYLPLPEEISQVAHFYWLGVGLLAIAVVLESFRFPRRKSTNASMNKLWLDFRDEFGTLWGLRLLERLNAAAERYHWDLRLTWHGFQRAGIELDAAWPESFETTFNNLLRRFVSPEWIASRIGKHLNC